MALQANGLSSLMVKGERKLCLTRDGKQFFLDTLVVENMDCDILAGIPFMAQNDITIRPARHEVILTADTSITMVVQLIQVTRTSFAVPRPMSSELRLPQLQFGQVSL